MHVNNVEQAHRNKRMQRTRVEAVQTHEAVERRGAASTPRRFPALQHRNYRLFWYGQLVSLIGTWMQSVAQQWLVYSLTGSATKLGIVAAAGTLPVLLFSLWAGVLVDRLPKRSVLVATQVSAMVLAFALAALVATGSVQFWHIVLLSALLGCVNTIDMPARQAFTPEMVGKEDLPSAIALNSSIFNGARVIGPSIAGLLVAAVGEAAAFTLNGVSYLAVIAGLLMMRLPQFTSSGHHGTPLLDLLDGVRYVARDPLKRVLIAALLVQTVFGTLHMTLMPVFAKDVFVVQNIPFLQSGELRLGLLMASSGLGALTAALMLASASERLRPGTRIMIGLFVYPISFILFSLTSSFWLALLLLLVGGWATITLLATCNTLLQTTTPDALRGRVMSLYSMTLVGFLPFSNLMAGFLAERLNSAPLAVRLSQLVVLATAVVIYFQAPRVRQAA
jgi:MFS family permease